jgi:NET1-associated nuclear protein 1 (U3 small nucleolar RNA-associated protein 17)
MALKIIFDFFAGSIEEPSFTDNEKKKRSQSTRSTTITPRQTSDNTMASILKRKRGAVEVQDAPKRTKSMKSSAENPLQKLEKNVDWEATLVDTPKAELIHTNGINGMTNGNGIHSPSPESIEPNMSERKGVKPSEAPGKVVAGKQAEAASIWRLSESIAGRMLNIEPVFTNDEK